MNIVWLIVVLCGTLMMIIKSPELLVSTMISASEKSVALCISLIAIYAVWMGLLKILEDTGFSKKLAKWLSPVIHFLFGVELDEYTQSQIAINISSNILGLGNAATPSAINAMKGLDDGSGKINNAMTMLMVLNCLSFQLIPTTIMGLRVSSGSTNASSIIFPTILTSLLTGVITITILKLIFRARKKRYGK